MLRQVAASGGTLPTAAEVRGELHSGSKNQRDAAYAGIMIAARRIRSAVLDASEDDNPDVAIAEIIETASEQFADVAGVDAGEDGPPSARRDADAIKASTGGVDRDARIAAARESKRLREPLRELLALAGPGKGVDPRDIDAITLRADISAEQRQAFRAAVQKEGDRIARLYAQGQHGESRAVAEQIAVKLSDSLAPAADHRDPHADVTDPRALAAAIRGGREV